MKDKLPKMMYPVIFLLGIIVLLYHIYKMIYNKDPWIHYIHLIYIGPLLLYIGWYQEKSSPKAFLIAIMIAGATFAYHLYRLLIKTSYI